MKATTKALTLGAVLAATVLTAQVASAHEGSNGGKGLHRDGLVTQEMREEWRQEFKDLDPEERRQLREERRTRMEEHRAELEEFTEEDAQAFLTENANERVDFIVEQHELDAADEQTLRDRIAAFVGRILDRWFGNA